MWIFATRKERIAASKLFSYFKINYRWIRLLHLILENLGEKNKLPILIFSVLLSVPIRIYCILSVDLLSPHIPLCVT